MTFCIFFFYVLFYPNGTLTKNSFHASWIQRKYTFYFAFLAKNVFICFVMSLFVYRKSFFLSLYFNENLYMFKNIFLIFIEIGLCTGGIDAISIDKKKQSVGHFHINNIRGLKWGIGSGEERKTDTIWVMSLTMILLDVARC